MALTTAAKIRALANWPASVTDPMLQPHLDGAARELRRWLQPLDAEKYAALVAETSVSDDRLTAEEIEACLAIAYAIPAMNVFAAASGPVVPNRIEDSEFSFLTPDQEAAKIAQWRNRATERFRGWDWTTPAAGETETGLPEPRWYVV